LKKAGKSHRNYRILVSHKAAYVRMHHAFSIPIKEHVEVIWLHKYIRFFNIIMVMMVRKPMYLLLESCYLR
jgi:hypothetical protein